MFGSGIGGLASGKKARIRLFAKVNGSYPSLPHDQQDIEKDSGVEFSIDDMGHVDAIKIEVSHDDPAGDKTFRLEGLGREKY